MKNNRRYAGLLALGIVTYSIAGPIPAIQTVALPSGSRTTATASGTAAAITTATPAATGTGTAPASATAAHASRAQQLGTLESLLHYCDKVDSTAAASLQTKVKELAAGLSASQLAKLRRSPDYRSAASEMEKFAAQVDPHNSKRLCLRATKSGPR